MTERPILFSAPMVRAILEGRKSQTRRVVKPQPGDAQWIEECAGGGWMVDRKQINFPYAPGMRLWVRESFSGPHRVDHLPPSLWPVNPPLWYWADGNPSSGDWTRPRPSIHMPRWASRILLEVTELRVERLQDISEADAIAEGCQRSEDDTTDNLPECPNCNGTGLYTAFSGDGGALPDTDCNLCDTPEKRYRLLWEQINGPGSWDANPWVWVVEFRRIEP